MRKNAAEKTSHGRVSTQTDGFIRKRVYQTKVAAKKIEQMM